MIALMRPRTPGNDVKIVFGDANTKVSRETIHHPTIGKYILRETTSENGLQLIKFAARRQMATRSSYFMHKKIHLQAWNFPGGPTFNQIDHCMIDRRYFSDIINVRAQRGANIDTQSIHDMTKSTTETFCSQKTEIRSNKLVSGFQCAHDDQARSLNELWYETEENIKKVAATTVSYAQSYKNSCARAMSVQIQNINRADKLTAMNEYRQA
jgi:hypothetical protein